MKSRVIIFSGICVLLIICICININLLKVPKSLDFKFEKIDASGNKLNINLSIDEDGDVDNDLALLGMNVRYKGNAKGNIYVVCENGNIVEANARNIGMLSKNDGNVSGNFRSVYVVGNELDFNGTANSVVLIGKKVHVSGKIKGNLKVIAKDVTFDKTLDVTGVISVESPTLPVYVDANNVNTRMNVDDVNNNNEIEFIKVEDDSNNDSLYNMLFRWFKFLVWLVPSGILTTFLFIKVLNPLRRSGVEYLTKSPFKLFATGLAALILVPATSLIFLVAIVGVQIAMIIILFYAICILISVSCLGVAIGELLFGKHRPYVSGALGTIINYILVSLPHVGIIALIISIIYTFGAIALIVIKNSNFKELDDDAKFVIRI